MGGALRSRRRLDRSGVRGQFLGPQPGHRRSNGGRATAAFPSSTQGGTRCNARRVATTGATEAVRPRARADQRSAPGQAAGGPTGAVQRRDRPVDGRSGSGAQCTGAYRAYGKCPIISTGQRSRLAMIERWCVAIIGRSRSKRRARGRGVGRRLASCRSVRAVATRGTVLARPIAEAATPRICGSGARLTGKTASALKSYAANLRRILTHASVALHVTHRPPARPRKGW
jgi:hypothetical protein